MSQIHLNKILASIVLVVALTTQALAAPGFRPFAHYQRDEFGGGPRQAQGMYGVVEGVYYVFAPVKNIVVGATNPDGSSKTREVYDGGSTYLQTNTINTSQLSTVSGFGTRAEVGNVVGHWGWYVGGYGLPNAYDTQVARNGTLVIDDSESNTAYTLNGGANLNIFRWNHGGMITEVPTNHQYIGTPIPSVGSLWGWFTRQWAGPIYESTIAPLPIKFNETRTTSRMEHWVVEAMGTYRLHPTELGSLDLIGGVRYMQLDDSLEFVGIGDPFEGVDVAVTKNTDGTETTTYTGSATGVGCALANSDWKFKAENHIIAPQLGARFSKRNNRWTLTAEGKFMAGFNNQNLSSSGTYGSHWDNLADIPYGGMTTGEMLNSGIYPWVPIGAYGGAQSFYYKKTHLEFSPGVEVKLGANWQLTNAVGIQFGVNAMWMDKIARGAFINNYSFNQDGSLFSLNQSGFNRDLLMYGVSLGVTINRF